MATRLQSGLLAISLTLGLSGCWKFETPYVQTMLLGMTAPEKAAFEARLRYFDCLRPHADDALAGPPLTDEQVERLGYACPTELREAAVITERYNRTLPAEEFDETLFGGRTAEERVGKIERELASAKWCDFRDCGPVM
ncbi:hypothetical protein [Sphingomonas sp. BK580]|uniref:hypothetical protein n=1 Tax=Sphingomonas sp. BK580 TaxID=2586972 RepID=UPI00160B3326|nr:hypothetical protein [Sphingomonas sp. BK580]MBB3692476.1 hypothetical protein [Sphingomonas sp. BK580]